ncbi:hypothetical protein N9N28_16550 [Rubripirellula amarantea]|nr:hypothetical protein [Rubripirellula amarantea]
MTELSSQRGVNAQSLDLLPITAGQRFVIAELFEDRTKHELAGTLVEDRDGTLKMFVSAKHM